jgi:hypothetical protein
MKDSKKTQYLWALFLLGICLLNYPLLAIYNVPKMWFGIPVLYFMVFFCWTVLIILTLIIVKRKPRRHV